MNLEKYRSKLIGDADERAVSPVIGVILMVAITVILAAVIAAFVLDMSPGSQTLSADANIEGDGTENITVELTAGGNDVDGIAFVDSSGDVDAFDEGVSKTGASGTYNNGSVPVGASGTSDGTGTLSNGDYTIYAYQGSVAVDGSIDDADANVQLGEVTYDDGT